MIKTRLCTYVALFQSGDTSLWECNVDQPLVSPGGRAASAAGSHDPYREEKSFRISGKRRSQSPPAIRHEVGPHTPVLYKISDIKFSRSSQKNMETTDETGTSKSASASVKRVTSGAGTEDGEQLSPTGHHTSRRQKFRIDGKMDTYPKHDPAEWYEVDSGYDRTPEGIPLSLSRSRSASPDKKGAKAKAEADKVDEKVRIT